MSNLTKIPSNKKCWQYLNNIVFTDELSCPVCSSQLQENYLRRYLWCRICRKKYRATSYKGSWLYGMKISPRQLFCLLWCWQKKKSTEAIITAVGVSYPTVTRWLTRFRDQLPDTTPLLEGIVKADESYFSKLRSKQNKYILTGAVTDNIGEEPTLALRITGDHQTGRKQEVLESFIEDTVTPGSLVVTDKWYGYQDLPLIGYYHQSHNHSKGDYSQTNRIEGVWSVLKRHSRKLYGGRILTHQLEDLCIEWMARVNRKELFKSPIEFLTYTLVPF